MSSFPANQFGWRLIYRTRATNRCVCRPVLVALRGCLLPHLLVVGPDKSVIKAAQGKTMASTGVCCLYKPRQRMAILLPNQILGPLRLRLLTSDRSTTIWDYWFDCSQTGEYRVSLSTMVRLIVRPISDNSGTGKACSVKSS